MEKLRKILTLVLTLALGIALISPVSAATITVNGTIKGQTYNAYKIFDVTRAGDSYAYSIDKSNDWFEVVENYATAKGTITLTQVGDTSKYVVDASKVDAADFAAYLNDYKADKKIAATEEGNGESIDLSLAEAGYYFVDSSLGALCILHTAADTQTVNEKNSVPTISKDVDKTSASVNEEVTFTLSLIAGGKADTSYIVHDTMSEGLTLKADTFTIKVGDSVVAPENYEIKTANLADANCTFEIVFKESYTATLAKDTEITITYKALINDKAVKPSEVENKVQVQYGNTYSPEDSVKVYNFDFDVIKVNGNNEQLQGARFKLYDALTGGNEILLVADSYELADGTVVNYYRPAQEGERPVEFIEAGTVSIKGLAIDKYYLEEILAPEGYNQLVARVEVDLQNDRTIEKQQPVNVVNTTGAQLPHTGGMGTVLFVTIGSVMVMGFGVLLVTKLRMSKISL